MESTMPTKGNESVSDRKILQSAVENRVKYSLIAAEISQDGRGHTWKGYNQVRKNNLKPCTVP